MAVIEQLLSAVQTRITARLGTVHYRFGEKFLAERKVNPRIIWVPGKDDYAPARAGLQTTQRSVRTRRAEVMAHVVHNAFGDTEDLVNATVHAMHAETHGSMDVDYGEWSQPDWLDNGYACSLRFVIDVPITAPAPTTVITTDVVFDTSTTVQSDGYLDAGEST